ncbi:MAG: competence/damage-inducible protein A [Phycisphaerae bacterium]
MTAAVVSVGDELTSGLTVDTNSAYLAAALGEIGYETTLHITVPDDRAAIADAIRQAASTAELVLVTGGLGPTGDDLTRDAMADVLGCELQIDEASVSRIEQFFLARGREMSENNRRQAMIPRGAEALANEHGTAPGIAARLGGARIFILPGVPYEMREMFTRQVLPRLGGGAAVVLHRTLHTFGAGESDVGAAIADLMQPGRRVHVGTTASSGLVSVRLRTRGESRAEAERLLEEVATDIRGRLGELIVGQEDEKPAVVVGRLLRERGQTLATAESCTGGMVGELITSVPGSTDYYVGGVVAYSNALKRDLLGVPAETLEAHGAVSSEVAEAMATGARQRLGTDWAVSLTGIAGPGGGTETKPVGLVFVALAGAEGVKSFRYVMPGTRDAVRLRSALAALDAVRLALLPRPAGNPQDSS